MSDVHLQNLALHLDRANQNPDLILRERLRVRRGQRFQFFGHGGMLVRGDLKLKAGPLPGIVQRPLLAQRLQAVDRICQQQARRATSCGSALGWSRSICCASSAQDIALVVC